MSNEWKYYNHALVPLCEPHENCEPPKNKRTFWKIGGGRRSLQDGHLILTVVMRLTGGM